MRGLLHERPARPGRGHHRPGRVRRPTGPQGRRHRGRELRIVAHRTCPLDAPENSLDGIRLAAELGADVVEIDVRLVRGVPVLVHDRPVIRRPRRLPTLREALDALPPGLGVALDVKEPRAMGPTLAVLGDRPALVWCRNGPALRGIATPDRETALLRNTASATATSRYLRDAVAAGADAVSLHARATTPAAVAEAHDLGLVVYAWALRPEMHEPMIAAGIDGLVTDWPERARRLVPRDGGPRTARRP